MELILYFSHPETTLKGVEVEIHYELCNYAPLMSRYLVVKNRGEKVIVINHFTSEIIAHPEKNNYVEDPRELVAENISFYKKYRDILNADIIHLRRPDGRDWDGILHVDPLLDIKGFAMLYNPTEKDIHRKITLPLYYTGLVEQAQVSGEEGDFKNYILDREYRVKLELDIPARGVCRIRIR